MTLLNALRWKLWNGFASSGWLLIILGVSPTVFGQNLVIAPQIVASPSVQIISLETDLRYQEGGAIFFNGVDAGLFDAISTQPVHGRYLWDEAFLGETTSLARYLWDEAKKLNPPPERFLWDEPAAPAGTVARYLWDDSSQSVPTTNRYLWDEATQPGVAIARYLWDERSALPQAPRAKFTPAISDLDRRTAGYLWQDFNRPIQIIEEDKPLKSYLGGKNHLLERNSELQIASSNGSGSHFGAASTVVLAGLDYSARSDAVLKFIDDRVLWSVKNQGQKSLTLKSLAASGPGGSLVSDVALSTGTVQLTDRLGAAEALNITGEIAPGETLTVSAHFTEGGIDEESEYAFSMVFENGQTVAFAPKRNLPLQSEHRDAFYPTLIRADELHRAGITGDGIGVAVIDTGAWAHPALENDTQGKARVVGFFDAVSNTEQPTLADENGHGSHITSVLASSERTYDTQGQFTGSFHGIAPDVDLLIVKAFNDESKSTYLDVVNAIAYVVKNRDRFNIKVLNLAFQGDAVAHYWQDPINQAVMAAWDAGITVVVSAGNSGPNAMTIGAPGNVPYVITVGAVTDHYTLDDHSDDYVATFSSVGPTLEGFIKPEMVAPGGHMMGVVPSGSTVTQVHPDFHDGFEYYLMSGTSQAAAAASGVAALMLQKDPSLSPDDVKCRLMISAKAAITNGQVTYSLLQQGAGLIDAVAALESSAVGCANQGLNLKADLAGVSHFKGPLTDQKEVESSLEIAANQRLSFVAQERVFAEPLHTHSATGLAPFNAVSGFDRTMGIQSVYVSSAELAVNGLDWPLSDLLDQGYWVDRGYQGLDNLAFDTRYGVDAQLMSSYLASLKQGRVNPVSWNDRSIESSGFIWNLSSPENAGFIWNLSSPENAGFIWNLSSPENAGFIWNL
ncbi:MAG: S8 family peptidase, partial [Pseudomonadales bacterium]